MPQSPDTESTSDVAGAALTSWIILHLRGHQSPFAFPVRRDDWERLQRAVVHTQSSPDDDGGFIAFDTLNRLEVAVRRQEIEYAEFLVDERGSDDMCREHRRWTVRLYFTGRVAPYEAWLGDFRTLAEFFLQVETMGVRGDAPLRLTHVEDRVVMVNPKRLALAICDSDLLAQGEGDLLEKASWRSDEVAAEMTDDEPQPRSDDLSAAPDMEGPNSCLLNTVYLTEWERDGGSDRSSAAARQ